MVMNLPFRRLANSPETCPILTPCHDVQVRRPVAFKPFRSVLHEAIEQWLQPLLGCRVATPFRVANGIRQDVTLHRGDDRVDVNILSIIRGCRSCRSCCRLALARVEFAVIAESGAP